VEEKVVVEELMSLAKLQYLLSQREHSSKVKQSLLSFDVNCCEEYYFSMVL